MATSITSREIAFIEKAVNYLEKPSLLVAIADKLGKPVEWLVKGIDTVSPISVSDLVDALLQGIMGAASASMSTQVLDMDFRTGHARSVRDGRWHAATEG